MAFVPIVGKFFKADGTLAAYLSSVNLDSWKPDFVVLHNTGDPTLAMRPEGFNAGTISNLAFYYAGLGWHAGPHFFVDQNGVWVFSRPDRPGVHSPSWNQVSWGVEMLGDYDYDFFSSGAGAAVAANAVLLLAMLHRRADLDSYSMKLHKWDPLTTHKDCPGASVIWENVQGRVHDLLASWRKPYLTDAVLLGTAKDANGRVYRPGVVRKPVMGRPSVAAVAGDFVGVGETE